MPVSSAVDYLNVNGGVVVTPTDTVYGLVARAMDKEAVSRLYGLKKRENKPGTVIAASIEQLVELGLKRRYLKAVEDYWPGPLSVIIPCGAELEYIHQGKFGIAVRIPDNKQLIELANSVGPLLSSSANLTGYPPANTIDEAKNYFEDNVDLYIDGGDLSGNLPSTIVRIVDDAIEIIRPGAFKFQESN
jgi:L-threonylcarbamoyladenylate synthase